MILRSLVGEARKHAGLTQAELGRRAGVPQSTVARIESGARTPSTDMVDRLVRAAGLEIRVSLGEPDPKPARYWPSRSVERPPSVLPTPPAPRNSSSAAGVSRPGNVAAGVSRQRTPDSDRKVAPRPPSATNQLLPGVSVADLRH